MKGFLDFGIGILAAILLIGAIGAFDFFDRSDEPRPELCEKVFGAQAKDDCFLRIARTSQKEAFCEKIASLRTKDECFSDLAVRQTWDNFD